MHREEDKKRWRQTSKQLLWLTYTSIFTVVLLLVLAFVNSANLQQKHYIAWAVALVFTAIAVPVPMHMIHMHLIHYRHSMQVRSSLYDPLHTVCKAPMNTVRTVSCMHLCTRYV
jgi:hypothetical protein